MQNLDKDWNAIAKAVESAGEDAKSALINIRAAYAEALHALHGVKGKWDECPDRSFHENLREGIEESHNQCGFCGDDLKEVAQ